MLQDFIKEECVGGEGVRESFKEQIGFELNTEGPRKLVSLGLRRV